MRFNTLGFPIIFSKWVLLKHPLGVFGAVLLCVGIPLSVLAVILFFVITDGEAAFTTLLAVGINGVVWLVLGLIFSLIARSGRNRLNDLKHEGRRFEAEITRLYPISGVHILLTPTVYAECVYVNDGNQRCEVKSPLFFWKSIYPEGLTAEVYVDYNAPQRYAVEISRKPHNDPKVDIEYT